MKNALDSLIHEALGYEADAFDNDQALSGADLLEWFAEWRERAKAVVMASGVAAEARQADEPMGYRIRYRHCGQEWEDTWSCASNDECPVCGAEIEPFDSEALVSS